MTEPKAAKSKPGVTRCGNSVFHWGTRTYVMGILNLSLDSFSGDGLRSVDDAMLQAQRMVEEGADIIDVGGESTRPGADPIMVQEELKRVMPFIRKAAKVLHVPISIDTYKLEVARQALDAGAAMINDVWGMQKETGLADLAAERKVPIALTSNQRGQIIEDIVPAVLRSLHNLVNAALEAGIDRENIIIDPGIGFGKTQEQNLELLNRLDELKAVKRPILLGTSRKSVIFNVVGHEVEERLLGTAASVAIGISRGADIVRVHDVKQMKMIAKMSDAIVRGVEVAEVFIGIGSNLGDKLANVTKAIKMLSEFATIDQISSLYETEPEGPKQPDFLNCVLKAEVGAGPMELLGILKDIENRMGREPAPRNGPRTIDLDLLIYNNQAIETPDLIVPHPRLHQRVFVLVPMTEVAPSFYHPTLHKSMRQLLSELNSSSRVNKCPDLTIEL
ncbi:MAG: dihydropteroate synthase [Dehalococcoidia bacterium]